MYLAKISKENNEVLAMISFESEDMSYVVLESELVYWVETTQEIAGKRFASVGDTYFENIDSFVAPKPYPSWVLDEDLAEWVSPKPHPKDEINPLLYRWSEENLDYELAIK
jgi:hypothetical protein